MTPLDKAMGTIRRALEEYAATLEHGSMSGARPYVGARRRTKSRSRPLGQRQRKGWLPWWRVDGVGSNG